MASPPRRAPRRGSAQGRPRQSRGVPADDEAVYEEDFAPRKRSVKMHPVAGIFLFGSPLVLFIFVVYLYVNKQDADQVGPVDPPDDNIVYEQLKRKMSKAQGLYRAAMSLRDSDDSGAFKSKVEEAKDFIGSLLDEFEEILAPVTGPNGELGAEYGEYARDQGQLQTWMYDLGKTGGF